MFDGRRVYRRRFSFYGNTYLSSFGIFETAVKRIYRIIILFAFHIDLLEIVLEAAFPSTLFISYTQGSVHRLNAMNV